METIEQKEMTLKNIHKILCDCVDNNIEELESRLKINYAGIIVIAVTSKERETGYTACNSMPTKLAIKAIKTILFQMETTINGDRH